MTGSLQIKNGTYYMVLNKKGGNGKRKQQWVSTGLAEKGNKRRAEVLLRKTLAEYESGGYVEPSKILFCDFLRDWVDMSKQRVQATTYMNYKNMLQKHLYPYFEELGIRLQDVNVDIIQKYLHKKAESGLSTTTTGKHYSVIRSGLQYALKLRLIKENPCVFVDKPKRKLYKATFYNAEEMRELFVAAKGSLIEVPVFLAAHFGLRRSEVLGLRWSTIDFTRGLLFVQHKIVRASEDGKLVNLASDELKTYSSYRTLPLDESLLEYLRDLKKQQERNQALCGNGYSVEYLDYVCVNPLGELIKPDYVSSAFVRLLERYNLRRIRFHDLRHSCASLLLMLGYSMKGIQEWLGHSNYQTTANLYAHVDPRNKVQMIQDVSKALMLPKAP